MARKKRGGKSAATARRTKATHKLMENVNQEENISQSPSESEESSNSGTPKSCNTPIEIDKPVTQTLTITSHKKFGKFRCLLEENKHEIMTNETETQVDAMEIDSKPKEVSTSTTESIIEGMKTVELSESMSQMNVEIDDNTQEDLSTQTPEINQDSNSVQEGENDETSDTNTNATEIDDNSNEGKSSDSNSKSNENEVSNDGKTIDNINDNTSTVRRSSRIRSINVLKQRSRGRGVVRSEKSNKKDTLKLKTIKSEIESPTFETIISEKVENETTPLPLDSPTFATPTLGLDNDQKPVKVKSRWRRSSELEMGGSSPLVLPPLISPQTIVEVSEPHLEDNNTVDNNKAVEKDEDLEAYDEEMENRLRHYITLTENQYLTERTSCKEAKKMVCDCFLIDEEIERGEYGCGDDCLNRLLMIECGSQCPVNDRCTNKRFQNLQYAQCEVFRTKKKGFGIRAVAPIVAGDFILEYVGEVLDQDEFDKRAKEYSKDKNRHYYFMALRSDAVIDATQKGNISRFINHSCEPNAETQKWTVNGELRIGFFSTRNIAAGEEITFDYQFQRYGKEAQKCYCEAMTCRGWIGEEPDDDEDDEDDEEDEEEDEEEDGDVPDKKEDDEDAKTDSDAVAEKVTKIKVKTEQKKRRYTKKQRKDIFEDLDLDEEIGMLSATGVKNQTHTLKLSRLMVRAKELAPRLQLLKLLRQGEEPCRRLFLDYHGLRLIHGWMTDTTSLTDPDNLLFRLEILKALNSLPIKNKTILQDSKVLSMVDKWSISTKTEITSPTDSDANSPNVDVLQSVVKIETVIKNEDEIKIAIEDEIKVEENDPQIDHDMADNNMVVAMDLDVPEEGMKTENELERIELENPEVADEVVIETVDKIEDEEKLTEKDILSLAAELLSRWLLLKEDFRIPKKERIKQMKEHEREADIGYKGLDAELDIKKRTNRYSWKSDRYRKIEMETRVKRDTDDKDKTGTRKSSRSEERNILHVPTLSKYERRQLFALQVQQEEEGRRRKQQEMWRQHEQRCLMMGQDPRMLSFEASANLQMYWNAQPLPNNNWQSTNFPPNLPPPNLPPSNLPSNLQPNIPPSHNLPPNIPPPHNLPPNIPTSLPPNIPPPNIPSNIPPNGPPNPQMFDIMNRPPVCQTSQRIPIMMPPVQNIGSPCVKGNINTPIPQQFQLSPVQPIQTVQQSQIPKEENSFVAPSYPPPVKLPPKWKCAKDQYGRPYYYHVKIRISQWEPPDLPLPPPVEATPELSETSSSSDTSSLSSDSSSDSEEDSELGDTKLLLEIRNKLKNIEQKQSSPQPNVPLITSNDENVAKDSPIIEYPSEHKEQQPQKRKRVGLVQEIIISPRTEEDRVAFKADMKRYKETKEKLKKQKMMLLEQSKKKIKVKPVHNVKTVKKHRIKHKTGNIDMNSEEAKRIKETFRNSIATVIVQHLNAYRKPDSKVGRITNTEDFKHLARKLTHFVLLKELKHCQSVEELTCNESVKVKAKDFIRKYMAKFGEVYVKPKDETDYY